MFAWIAEHLAVLLICLVLAAVVAVAITVLVRDKQKGKSSCGGKCSTCPMGGSCHNH
ncbi:MAG: FeoB-associated Cys-rich membrane protein [Oscillospiraceae bacterium]|jgi:ABC-type proline/glycine betaine transport system permease subunit|nr:FeoB-associated Cys-rich membrane protein [Oscillospiraceae bacterium]